MKHNLSFRLHILALAFCCGFSIMTVELLGGKIMAPYFGGSIYVWGSIITVFMLALSIGYLLGGRWSINQPNTRKYGSLFIFSALLLLPMIFFGDAIMNVIFAHVEDPRFGSLLGASGLFLLPTIAMGMIAPYSVRLLVLSTEHSGQTAGFLYFVSTIGSALGTIMTSFYLVLFFEINTILWVVFFTFLICGGSIAFRSESTDELEITDSNASHATS
ncbi:fused MFS/spermidine synthase [Pleionea litopenaei]|uniref:Fused MFS/spermidine synthase n=1 Tax=Pleionea litopenaei TaxID=3070815 RepID=A0AA51RV93_9GAMM|nr:fused MFS/spermidine synthase [Pleionea sp. HL-JVS1]WMS88212.1 fused MFS/spermidine synthase [Pleionea sp. HL-JVS1]